MDYYTKLLNKAIKQSTERIEKEFCCHNFVDYTLDHYTFEIDEYYLKKLLAKIKNDRLDLTMSLDWVFDLTILYNKPKESNNELKPLIFEFVDIEIPKDGETLYEIVNPSEFSDNYDVETYCINDDAYLDRDKYDWGYKEFVTEIIDHFKDHVKFSTTNKKSPYINLYKSEDFNNALESFKNSLDKYTYTKDYKYLNDEVMYYVNNINDAINKEIGDLSDSESESDLVNRDEFYDALNSFKKVLNKYIEGNYDELIYCALTMNDIDKLNDELEYISDNLY